MHLSATHRPRRTETALTLLGRGHPLVRVEERIQWLRRQGAAVATLLTGSAAALVAGATELLALLLAATAVQATIALGLLAALGDRRRRALELIVDGRSGLPLDAVERERDRLAHRVGALAGSFDRLRVEARRPQRSIIAPLYVRSVIREVDEDLARTARLLRSSRADVAAVARAEELLGGAASPLYGDDVRRLREELGRLQFALSMRPAS
jgi:hypothetical protein